MLRRFAIAASVLSAFLAGSAFVHKMTLEIPFMKPGSALPKRYTKKEKNISPPLVWSRLPNDVREFALILEDIDEPRVQKVPDITVPIRNRISSTDTALRYTHLTRVSRSRPGWTRRAC